MVKQTEKDIQTIVSNNKLTVEDKIFHLNKIAEQAIDNGAARLKEAHNKRDQREFTINRLSKNRQYWNLWFVWIQISGLALLSGSEIIDKVFMGDET